MFSNVSSVSKRSSEQMLEFLQLYTYSRSIHEPNGSSYMVNMYIEEPDVFNIREVESQDGYTARNELDSENFTDEEQEIQQKQIKDTQDSLKQTAYFSEEDSHENINNTNIAQCSIESVKSKLLSKLIKEKSRKKSELEQKPQLQLQKKMEDDISYLKRLRKHCNLR